MAQQIRVFEFVSADMAPDTPSTHVNVELLTESGLAVLRVPKAAARELAANLLVLQLGPDVE
jgi:hypothetical protein